MSERIIILNETRGRSSKRMLNKTRWRASIKTLPNHLRSESENMLLEWLAELEAKSESERKSYLMQIEEAYHKGFEEGVEHG